MNTEDKKNELNKELRSILTIIDIIDGNKREYEDYVPNTLDENTYLDIQIKLAKEASDRLRAIFR